MINKKWQRIIAIALVIMLVVSLLPLAFGSLFR